MNDDASDDVGNYVGVNDGANDDVGNYIGASDDVNDRWWWCPW